MLWFIKKSLFERCPLVDGIHKCLSVDFAIELGRKAIVLFSKQITTLSMENSTKPNGKFCKVLVEDCFSCTKYARYVRKITVAYGAQGWFVSTLSQRQRRRRRQCVVNSRCDGTNGIVRTASIPSACYVQPVHYPTE